jgi:hypothetical protein
MTIIPDSVPEDMAHLGCPSWCSRDHADDPQLDLAGVPRFHESRGVCLETVDGDRVQVRLELVEDADWRGPAMLTIGSEWFDVAGLATLVGALDDAQRLVSR